jgi:glycosyltransferase involved in cell wall biosynthesis
MPLLQHHFGTIARRLAPRPIQIAFITNHTHVGLAREMGENLRRTNEKCELRFVPWSRAAVAVELARADLVLLPQDAASEWGRVKSHNRLVEALRAGRFAIASPIPSYLELSDYAWIGEPLADGVEWALAHPIDVLAKLRAGQNAVEQRFSPRKIGERWASTLNVIGK